MSNGNFSATSQPAESNKKNENDRHKVLIALIFLLFSFGCIFCSSQGALWFISEDRVDASILSNRVADYGMDGVAAAPLNREALATEIYQDGFLLQQTVTTSGIGEAVVMVMPTAFPSATPLPVAQLLPTFTPTPTFLPTATPQPTSPPVSTATPTSPLPSPVPATATLPPATATLPPPTPVEPTPIPPTAVPPTPTDVVPIPTDPPPTSPPPTSPPPTSPPPTSPPANNPPTVVNDTVTTNEDTPVTINVLANDFDSDGTIQPATLAVTSGPANGTAVVSAGQVLYTPNANYFGNDSFTYRVCDNDGACATATVTIIVNPVNDPPVAVDDTASTANGMPVTIVVLANDSDPEGGPLWVIAAGGLSGTVGINLDNTVTYTPTAGITGTHVFTYTIQDNGGLTDSAVVSVMVTSPPVAVDDTIITTEDIPISIDVLSNDSDPDGDPLVVIFVGTPAHGTATLNSLGYTVTYHPDMNYHGPDSFTYTISDGIFTATATVNITVLPVNDPPVAVDDVYTTAVNSILSIPAPGLLGNDFDVDGNTVTVEITSVSPPSGGSVGVSPDGAFIYTAPATAGVYTFTYQAQDTIGALSNVATVTITVTP